MKTNNTTIITLILQNTLSLLILLTFPQCSLLTRCCQMTRVRHIHSIHIVHQKFLFYLISSLAQSQYNTHSISRWEEWLLLPEKDDRTSSANDKCLGRGGRFQCDCLHEEDKELRVKSQESKAFSKISTKIYV